MEKFGIHWFMKVMALTIMIPAVIMFFVVLKEWPKFALIAAIIIGAGIFVTLLPFVSGASIEGYKLRYGGFIKKTLDLKKVDHMEEEKYVSFNLQHGQYSGIGLRIYMNNRKSYFVKNSRGYGYPQFYNSLENKSGKKIKEFQFGKYSREEINQIMKYKKS